MVLCIRHCSLNNGTSDFYDSATNVSLDKRSNAAWSKYYFASDTIGLCASEPIILWMK